MALIEPIEERKVGPGTVQLRIRAAELEEDYGIIRSAAGELRGRPGDIAAEIIFALQRWAHTQMLKERRALARAEELEREANR